MTCQAVCSALVGGPAPAAASSQCPTASPPTDGPRTESNRHQAWGSRQERNLGIWWGVPQGRDGSASQPTIPDVCKDIICARENVCCAESCEAGDRGLPSSPRVDHLPPACMFLVNDG